MSINAGRNWRLVSGLTLTYHGGCSSNRTWRDCTCNEFRLVNPASMTRYVGIDGMDLDSLVSDPV